MTTFTHPKLLAALQKACPELLELTFGCEVDRHWDKKEIITGRFNDKVALTIIDKDGWAYLPFEVPLSLQISADWTILGREPQLVDVLRAMDEKNANFLVDLAGVFWQQLFVGDEEIPPAPSEVQWNLSLGLYGQSTEVLDFLESLLVSE